jgi:hypothetical protein
MTTYDVLKKIGYAHTIEDVDRAMAEAREHLSEDQLLYLAESAEMRREQLRLDADRARCAQRCDGS